LTGVAASRCGCSLGIYQGNIARIYFYILS
jgi:hypothetical protein